MDAFLNSFWLPISLLLGTALDALVGSSKRHMHCAAWLGKMLPNAKRRVKEGESSTGRVVALSALIALATLGATMVLLLLAGLISVWAKIGIATLLIFLCVDGRTAVSEAHGVFYALDKSIEDGRRRAKRIIPNKTEELTDQEIRTATLETLPQALNNGMAAPLFWLSMLGIPGMVLFKLINTLASTAHDGYATHYGFNRMASRLDNILGFLPAQIVALLMLVTSKQLNRITIVWQNGRKQLPSNTGYPSAALWVILNHRGNATWVNNENDTLETHQESGNRSVGMGDLTTASQINLRLEPLFVALALIILLIKSLV